MMTVSNRHLNSPLSKYQQQQHNWMIKNKIITKRSVLMRQKM